MTLVLTLMVRDEADIIAAMLEHHLAHGVDHILVTDNGSVDGTREILDAYAEVAPITVLEDREHRKQQAQVVTAMARRASTELGADWVINADADEFLRPVDPGLTLREAFAQLPTGLGAFQVPVVNLVGPLARSGSGLRRLVHRDLRDEDELRAHGLIAQPTPNAVHIGSPDVEVSQGNHRVSIEQRGEIPSGLALEVLHLPWRSIDQIERKTRSMGEAYDANPDLRPSPRHHGMRDWRRMRAGLLLPFIAWRTPTGAELETEAFRRDASLVRSLEALDARLPTQLRASLDDAGDDQISDEALLEQRRLAEIAEPLERLALEELSNARLDADALRQHRDQLGVQLQGVQGHAAELERELERVRQELDASLHDASELRARASRGMGGLARRLRRVR